MVNYKKKKILASSDKCNIKFIASLFSWFYFRINIAFYDVSFYSNSIFIETFTMIENK